VVALPGLFLILLWLFLLARDPRQRAIRCLMRGFVLTGVWLVLLTEVLSLPGWISQSSLGAAWGVGCLILAVGVIARRARLAERLPVSFLATRGEWGLVAAVGVVLAVTAAVAWLAPPQTWDSLNYHMARVAHWAQLHAVQPFATGIEVQNSRSPGAEFGVLQLYVLASGDRWVNFVEWAAMAGSVIGVAGLATQLGLRRPAPLLSAVYAATIPMGIVQASSTMTDYVVALWLVATAGEVIGMARDPSPNRAVVYAGAGAGLAMVTKPTAAPYLLALFLIAVVGLLRQRPARVPWAAAALGLAVLLVVNLGAWARNTAIYGDPLSGGDQLAVHANQVRDVRGLVSNTVRNVALHLGTPSPHVNKALTLALLELHRLIGLDANDPRTTAHGVFEVDEITTNENKTGNLIHFLIGAAAVGYVIARRKVFDPEVIALMVAVLGGFVLFGWVFKWQIFGSRYHLALFVLLAPIAGGAMGGALSRRGSLAVGGLMLLGCLPWLVGVASRPIVPLPGEANSGSVLSEPRVDLLFANGPYLKEPYSEMARAIRQAQCEMVWVSLAGNQAEYPLWVLLGAPREGILLEWNVAGTPSARFARTEPAPCAVICEGCENDSRVAGLSLAWEYDTFRLYLAQGQAQ